MKCGELRELADSYLGDELLVETNHEVIRHLESCTDCRRELAARRALRARLRTAINNAPEVQIRAEFAEQLRAQLRAYANRRNFLGSYGTRDLRLALAACLVVGALFGVHSFWQSRSQTTVRIADTNRDKRAQT